LYFSEPRRSKAEGFVPRGGTKSVSCSHEWREQPIRMRTLHITLDALWTEHASIERELFPWFKPDHLVVAHFELNSALLAAEATVGLHQCFGGVLRFALPASRRLVIQMGTIALHERGFITRRP